MATQTALPSAGPEVMGYSARFDFGEAFQDAMSKLPPPERLPNPDIGSEVKVVFIGAVVGGTAPDRGLMVGVRYARRESD